MADKRVQEERQQDGEDAALTAVTMLHDGGN